MLLILSDRDRHSWRPGCEYWAGNRAARLSEIHIRGQTPRKPLWTGTVACRYSFVVSQAGPQFMRLRTQI